MNRFKSIKIIHNILQRIDFSYVAEFFRFMGILVCEEILMEQAEDRGEECADSAKRTVYSAEVFVGKRRLREDEARKLNITEEGYAEMAAGLPEKTVHFYDDMPSDGRDRGVTEKGQAVVQDGNAPYLPETSVIYYEKEKQKEILHCFLDRILQTVYEPGDAEGFGAGQLGELISVYVEQEIWLHSLNMQYYGRRPSEIITEAEQCFLKSQEIVEKALEKKKGQNEQYLYEYAFLWCQVKANSACHYNNEILYFSIEKLSERCRELCRKFPGFSNALVLLGLSYEPSSGSANEAVAAFMEALEEIGSECFASAVYYWIGKRYEGFRDKREIAEKQFEIANQRKQKFRNIFKLAIAARDRGEAETALELFEKIPDKLAIRKGMRFTDPLELEYLFKTYFQQSYICYDRKDYVRAIKYGIRCTDVWEKEIEKSSYFEAFYGKGPVRDYRKILKVRLDVVKEYRILADCYAKVFDKERADEYYKKAKELS